MGIRYDITSAQEGSDIHGVVEKVAYQLYLKGSRSEDSQGENWFDALGRVADWAERVGCNQGSGVESYLKGRLQTYAHFYSFSEVFTDFDNWMLAQDRMARLMMDEDDLILE